MVLRIRSCAALAGYAAGGEGGADRSGAVDRGEVEVELETEVTVGIGDGSPGEVGGGADGVADVAVQSAAVRHDRVDLAHLGEGDGGGEF